MSILKRCSHALIAAVLVSTLTPSRATAAMLPPVVSLHDFSERNGVLVCPATLYRKFLAPGGFDPSVRPLPLP